MKKPRYSGKTFADVSSKIEIASDKIYDAIDIIMDLDSPYRAKHDEMIRKKLQRIADMISKTWEEIESIDNKYRKS